MLPPTFMIPYVWYVDMVFQCILVIVLKPLHRLLVAGWFNVTGITKFSALMFQVFVATLTIVMTYRVAIDVFYDSKFRYWAGLLASIVIVAMMPHVFLSRNLYRGILTPLAILLALEWSLRVYRKDQGVVCKWNPLWIYCQYISSRVDGFPLGGDILVVYAFNCTYSYFTYFPSGSWLNPH